MRWLGIGLVAGSVFAQAPDFTKDIRPLLAKRCYACHSGAQQMSGLRLDEREAAVKGGYSGKAAVVPGQSSHSALIERISSTKEGFAMPPAGPKLSAAEIETLKKWIDGGAIWAGTPSSMAGAGTRKSDHWAFQPVRRPALPAVKNGGWVRNPIDAFVLAKLESQNIAPSPEASKTTLLRRVSLDLRGLPPTLEETREFLADSRPDAYERMVDRFLAAPQFGEKWARPWLDLARYADSDGYEKDLSRPYAWRWRNWVIDAINRDMPFSDFTIQQIAGDLLPNATTEQRVATGFHRNVMVNREAGVSRVEDRFEQTINRTNTVSTTWLGLTSGCAQCHDHKYDPISQREYYQLFAFLNATADEDINAPMPGELGPWMQAQPEYQKKRTALLAEYKIPEMMPVWEQHMRDAIQKPGANLEWDFAVTSFTAMLDNGRSLVLTPVEQRTPIQQERLTNYFVFNLGPDNNRDKELTAKIKELREKLKALDEATPKLTQAAILQEPATPVQTVIAIKGDYKRPGIPVTADVPAVLPKMTAGNGEPPRLAFARWVVSPENPLTPRVIMNRDWQELFGRGLVRTSEDFGTQGEKPTHPELLDYLASEFVQRDWSRKQMLRLMVTSATYRQSSKVRPELSERDPDNSLLARQGRLRLSAELLRDEALAVSGLLDTRVGGPSIKPPQPAGVAELTYANSNKWKESTGGDRYRRGLYIHFQRTAPYPQLMNFDAPEGTVACSRRRMSDTPLQSLNLLNDPVFYEAAQALAFRAPAVSPAFELALGRTPTEKETARLEKLRQDQGMVAVARVLLNLDEFITRE